MALPVRLIPALVGALVLSSCASVRPVRTIVLPSLTVHIADEATITAERFALTGERLKVNGFCRPKTHEIWYNGDPEILEHELRHMYEWDGLWHVTGFSGKQIDASTAEGVAGPSLSASPAPAEVALDDR